MKPTLADFQSLLCYAPISVEKGTAQVIHLFSTSGDLFVGIPGALYRIAPAQHTKAYQLAALYDLPIDP